MSQFLDSEFLLDTPAAVRLYEKAAADLPIFDFHCHLDPKEVWENKPWANITQLWLGGDHYKWRTMRMHGIGEQLITGDAEDWDKFMAWAETVPHLIGNPLYHWTHLELKNVFGIEQILSPATALDIWEACNAKLQQPDFLPRALIARARVKFIGTTDDPLSSLEYHERLAADDSFQTIIAPTFRPDGALYIERPTYTEWVHKLGEITGQTIGSLDAFLNALQRRVDYFDEHGGRASDHDIPYLDFADVTKDEIVPIFSKRLNSEVLSGAEINAYRSFLLKELGKMYAGKQWVMQLHMGALRNTNTKMKKRIGADTGFDSVGETNLAQGLARFLDALDQEDTLPRTVLFNLNPKDNAVLAAMTGNFYEEGVPGKVQFGSGWWFNDHIDGMEKQMKDLANVGLLSHFIGMLTDSRSFLSYARHEYFRRILCNLLGAWVEKGLVPNDMEALERMVRNIGYGNAEAYFMKR
ncbi:glucuronate isomerase [Paenibacillus favisporus]|uniref:glucuronate isomerase n=1 Tax=Paenibacillus favisporus TaxID=221028 RepID=UPI002DBD06F0|nr:glucuronate isomerase [Paenibacillus favisporus]MEC0174085.1 glucuronate isomerase [Paenibacillus favisporus]